MYFDIMGVHVSKELLKLKKWQINLFLVEAYRRWSDKTSYLKNVTCSGEPKTMAALTL